MKALKSIVAETIKDLGLLNKFREETVIFNWQKIVGEDIFAHTQPLYIRRGVLTVNANNSMWAHHLTTMQSELIERINSFIGQKVIREIRFQAGNFRPDPNHLIDNPPEKAAPTWRDGNINQQEKGYIEQLTAQLSDNELRKKLQRLMVKDFSVRRAKEGRQWHPCKLCGALCPPEDVSCTVCRLESRQQAVDTLRTILMEAPWLTFQECSQFVACRESDYRTIKHEMADKLLKALETNPADRMSALALTMIWEGKKPQTITEELVQKTLSKVGGHKHVSTSRR